jgi:hypothetical protein
VALVSLLAWSAVLGCSADDSSDDATSSDGTDTGASVTTEGNGTSVGTGDSGHDTDTGDASDSGGGSTTGAGTTGSGADECDRDHAIDIETHAVETQDTDSEIRDGDEPHYYALPDPAEVGKLFVFFPGATARPEQYQHILRNAAAGGYHAIGLSYVNDLSINFDYCQGSPDPDCQEKIRKEIITGEDHSELIEIPRPDSIENRLIKLLQHLGWTQFLDGEEPRWSDISFAGHSQGGGHAAMMGTLQTVNRAVLFAATEPAAWTNKPHPTPSDRYWAFVHTGDVLATSVKHSWENLGIPGQVESVDGADPPFGGTHRLETSDTPADGNAHNAPVVDEATPFEGAQPVYRYVWCLLIGP